MMCAAVTREDIEGEERVEEMWQWILKNKDSREQKKCANDTKFSFWATGTPSTELKILILVPVKY